MPNSSSLRQKKAKKKLFCVGYLSNFLKNNARHLFTSLRDFNDDKICHVTEHPNLRGVTVSFELVTVGGKIWSHHTYYHSTPLIDTEGIKHIIQLKPSHVLPQHTPDRYRLNTSYNYLKPSHVLPQHTTDRYRRN